MKCGSCKGEHETVAEVRSCYGIKDSNSTALRPNKYAGKCHECGGYIQAEQGHIEQTAAEGWKVFHNGECPPASKAPAQVLKRTADYQAIPEGRYAVKSLTGNNDLDFFKVDKPTQGQWKGYIFCKRIIGGHPDMPVKGATKFAALDAILAAGPEKASILFAQEIGQCRFCYRHLTRRIPRFNGQGNDCASDRGLIQQIPSDSWRPDIQDEVALWASGLSPSMTKTMSK